MEQHNPPPSLQPELRARLGIYINLLNRWNRRINLVSRQEETTLWERHFQDCLQVAPLLPTDPAMRGIDLGSGAGFPGLVLAIATNRHFDLVEADRRKAAFLREVVRETAASATVHATRIEDASLAPCDIVTARALAPLDRLLHWAQPFLKPDGACLFLKGRQAAGEVTTASRTWRMHVDNIASRSDPAATILKITAVRYVGPHGEP